MIYLCAAAGLDLSRAEAVGCGRACQRPRTSSGANCFSCEGALAKDPQIFNFLKFIQHIFPKTRVALPEATPSPFGTTTLLLAALGGQMRSAPAQQISNKKNLHLKKLIFQTANGMIVNNFSNSMMMMR